MLGKIRILAIPAAEHQLQIGYVALDQSAERRVVDRPALDKSLFRNRQALASIDVETKSAEIDQCVHLFAHVPVLRRVRDDCAEVLQGIQEISAGPPGPGALKQQLQTCRYPN